MEKKMRESVCIERWRCIRVWRQPIRASWKREKSTWERSASDSSPMSHASRLNACERARERGVETFSIVFSHWRRETMRRRSELICFTGVANNRASSATFFTSSCCIWKKERMTVGEKKFPIQSKQKGKKGKRLLEGFQKAIWNCNGSESNFICLFHAIN